MPGSARRPRRGPDAWILPRAIGKVAAPLRPWRVASVIAAGLGGGLALSAAVCGAAQRFAGSPRTTSQEAAERPHRPIMVRDIDRSLAGARLLRARLAAGDVPGAQKAWIDSRVGWERSEVFTSGFVPDLDREIDAWPNALLGFHAIEAKLFGAKRTDLKPETDALILNLEDLDVKIRHLDLLPQRLLNGTARLAYEIGESKAAGGESAFSGTSLNDMRDQRRWHRDCLRDHLRRCRRSRRSQACTGNFTKNRRAEDTGRGSGSEEPRPPASCAPHGAG